MRILFSKFAALALAATFGALTAFASPPEAHRFMPDYEGSQTCAMCHSEQVAEFMQTTHWTWDYTDPDSGQELGKNTVINNYCIAVASNEPRCTSCHAGLGYADKTFDFTDATKVDCLICHDTTGTYKKFPTGAGHPVYDEPKEFPPGSGNMWPPPDLDYVAKNAGLTSRATCGACHFYGGGGDAVKHGDLDSTLLNPNREVDVHMAVDGGDFRCTACHKTENHHMSGSRYPTGTTDNQTCEGCHTATPHSSDRLDAHTSRVACQTCHIPEFARGGKATKMWWDWSKAGLKTEDGGSIVIKDENGNPTYDTKKGEFTWEADVVPEYVWFNGESTYVTLDDQFEPGEIVTINQLHGELDESKARIFPVKRFRGIQPYDAGAKTLAVPHLFGSDENAYWKSYDWNKALAAGMEYLDRSYSGELGFVETEMFWIQNHMVAPKEQALDCTDCHVPRGRLDFAGLGYPPEQALALETMAGFEIDDVQVVAQPHGLQLKWTGTPGHRYQVQRTDGLSPLSWTDAPDGERVAGDTPAELTWSEDLSPDANEGAFYRILRTDQ